MRWVAIRADLDGVVAVTDGVGGEGEGVGARVVDAGCSGQLTRPMLGKGVDEGDIQAILEPEFRSLDAPLLRVSETGPWVVGFHLMVYG